MKKEYLLSKFILLLAILSYTSVPAFAQFEDAGTILRSGKQDANTLLREYLKPVGKGFGTDLNSGWFTTAKPHKTLGFDVTVNVSAAIVPGSDELFDIRNLTFQEVELLEGGPTSPTIAGEDFSDAVIGKTYRDPRTGQQERLFEFELPEGTGFPYVPAPMIQASVGLIKSTDVTLRYLPPVPMPSDVEVNLFGLGLKHRINQWLPGGKLLPIDLSVQAGFTNLSASVDFEVLPEVDEDTRNDFPSSTWEGQKAEFSTNSFAMNALVGKTLPIISVYAGLGYQTSTVEVGTPGSYPVIVPNEDYNPNDPNSKSKKVAKVDDPVDLTYDDNSGVHALAGMRIRLLIFNISASYTLSKYPVAQVGFGFGIR